MEINTGYVDEMLRFLRKITQTSSQITRSIMQKNSLRPHCQQLHKAGNSEHIAGTR